MPGPNANGFALQWNIGFKPIFHQALFGCIGAGNVISFCVGSILNIFSATKMSKKNKKHDPKSTEF